MPDGGRGRIGQCRKPWMSGPVLVKVRVRALLSCAAPDAHKQATKLRACQAPGCVEFGVCVHARHMDELDSTPRSVAFPMLGLLHCAALHAVELSACS